MRPFLLALALSAAFVGGTRAGDLRYFDDAPLHAVQMWDQNEGWAVGDDGVVWHTIDGGKDWERLPTGIRASLRSLHFLTPYLGWVAGREELAGGGSTGVLLLTRDGGLKWQRVPLHVLPGLNRIRFVNEKIGIVAGDGTDQHPSGIFMTTDGGRSWNPVPGPRSPSWLAADFQPGQADNVVFAGAWGRLGALRSGRLVVPEADSLGTRSIRALQFLPPTKPEAKSADAIAVGQGGVVLMSDAAAGASWAIADLKLPVEVTAALDFHAVACAGKHIWVAGRPGSVLLHSADRGATWELQRTGQSLALNGLFFLDEQRGWAVGELGTMLHTGDGGKTWTVQRRGGMRSAVLSVHARATGVPVDALSWLGGEQGYLAIALRVVAADPASAEMRRGAEALRFAAAVRQSGGAGGELLWQFPVPQHRLRCEAQELVKGWDKLHAGRATDELLRQLVLAIRIWRPDVVITDHPDPKTQGQTADAVIAEAMHHAFQQAADPQVFPEQIERLGLEPWKITKVYSRWEESTGAHVALDVTEPCPRLEASPRDFSATAASLLADSPPALPAQRYFRLLDSRLESAAGHRDLMQGVALAPGGMARRKLPAVELGEELRKSLQARRNLQAMADSISSAEKGGLLDADKLLARIGPSLTGMTDDQAAPAAFAIANQYARLGQWSLAREVFRLMADRYPTHPLSAEAYRWLIRYHCSSEARRRQDLGQFVTLTQVEYTATPQGPITPPKPEKPKPDDRMPKADEKGPVEKKPVKFQPQAPDVDGTIKQTRQFVPLANGGEPSQAASAFDGEGNFKLQLDGGGRAQRWYQGGLALEPKLAAVGPLLANDPSLQFCLQSARRNMGDFDSPRKWYADFISKQPVGPWRAAAESELWLNNRSGPPPKPVLTCRLLDTRPFLDGKLDEGCWEGIRPVFLRNAIGKTVKDQPADAGEDEYATEVWLAYDKDFLYFACHCHHPTGQQVPAVKVRPRDADLRPYDRVSLLLDLDRDYASYFRLEIDQRGCVAEDCWGDRTWNPRWFVAYRADETGWWAEAAIPLHELTGEVMTSGRAWACNVVRTLPGRGVQAFATPADVQPRPEGMGLLIFTTEPRRTAAAPR